MTRPGTGPVPPGPWLALDTATSHTVVALGDGRGARASRVWDAGRRHGETLLGAIEALLRHEAVAVADLQAIVVGTGPGAFTGLRVGLATAKTLAHGLHLPLVGVPTAAALARSLGTGTMLVVQPAGPHDRYVSRVVRTGPRQPAVAESRLVPGGERLTSAGEDMVLVVDLPASASGDIDPAQVRRGRTALAGLPGGLLAEGAAALAAGRRDDPAVLVPLYVTLPRGVPDAAGGTAWSPDLP